MPENCPHCGSLGSVINNNELIPRYVVMVCTKCKMTWLDQDSMPFEPGPGALGCLRMRAAQLDEDKRWIKMMEDDELWQRIG